MAVRVGEGTGPASVDVQKDAVVDAPVGRRRLRLKILVVVVAVSVGLGGAAYGYERASAGHFYPGTRIGGLAVGSRTPSEVEALLSERYVLPLRKPIKLTAPEFGTNATPWEMGMRVDVAAPVRSADVRQRSEPFHLRLWHRIAGDDTNIRVRPSVDDKIFDSFLDDTFKKIAQPPHDARLSVSGDRLNVTPHQLGRKVDEDAAEGRIFAAMRDGEREAEIPVNMIEPAWRTEHFSRVIVISTGSNTLKLYNGGAIAKRYGVATGTGGYPTPHGLFPITLKRMNPTWVNPYSDWSKDMPAVIGPGRNNPLGTRALNLSAPGIRIHGTPDDASIGTNASHGCIRMHMADAEELFDRVEVGTPVLVVP